MPWVSAGGACVPPLGCVWVWVLGCVSVCVVSVVVVSVVLVLSLVPTEPPGGRRSGTACGAGLSSPPELAITTPTRRPVAIAAIARRV